MGAEDGASGGYVVVAGTPEGVAAHEGSPTGRFLKLMLRGQACALAVRYPTRAAAFLWVHQRMGCSRGNCCLTRITVQGASIATLIGTVATSRCICRPWVAAPITIMLTWLPCA